MKPKRGQKTCKSCDQVNGARAYTCKKCGEPCVMKDGRIRYSKGVIGDWRTLEPGDHFKVKGRSGDYYYKENGDKHYWSKPGSTYRVIELQEEGISAYGVGGRGCWGHTFIYMGPEKPSSLGLACMVSAPHKLVRVKNP